MFQSGITRAQHAPCVSISFLSPFSFSPRHCRIIARTTCTRTPRKSCSYISIKDWQKAKLKIIHDARLIDRAFPFDGLLIRTRLKKCLITAFEYRYYEINTTILNHNSQVETIFTFDRTSPQFYISILWNYFISLVDSNEIIYQDSIRKSYAKIQ